MEAAQVVLVIDDSRPIREVLARRLTREGFEVLTADSGIAGLDSVSSYPVSLVLLDLELPDLSGLDVLHELRESFSLVDLPVFMISSNDEPKQMAHAIQQGANDYFAKPLQFELLLAKIRQQFSLRPQWVSPAGTVREKITLKIGDTVAHFRLLEVLGEGGLGRVFGALDTRLMRNVALKVITNELAESRTLERFFLEARAAAVVDHPGVVRMYELGFQPVRYLAMELVRGQSLHQYAKRGLSVEQAVDLVRQLLDALSAVHTQGIVHRDLKPANMMVDEQGRLKLMDFGLAMTDSLDPSHIGWNEQVGTPQYMAPECVAKGLGNVDQASDLFAVGILLYQLLTGQLPFYGESNAEIFEAILQEEPAPPSSVNPEVPRWLDQVCARALAKKKLARFPDARSFAAALAERGSPAA